MRRALWLRAAQAACRAVFDLLHDQFVTTGIALAVIVRAGLISSLSSRTTLTRQQNDFDVSMGDQWRK